ncbi:hypothetical protein YC2023_066359 [Brassica napus]
MEQGHEDTMLGSHPGGRVTGCSIRCDQKYSENLRLTIEEHQPCHFRSTTIGGVTVGGIPLSKDVFINQERKLGARRRSDTVLVSTINDADQGSADVAFRTPLAPYEKSKFLGSGGSMVARLKLIGIDGRAPPGVEHAA